MIKKQYLKNRIALSIIKREQNVYTYLYIKKGVMEWMDWLSPLWRS